LSEIVKCSLPSSFEAAAGARSWLFAPGDSDKKMEKARASAADIVILDLEDAVAEPEKPAARKSVVDFLKAHPADAARLWVRINPVQTELALADLAAIMPGKPGGVMLPKPRGRADAELLGHYLTALEAANGTAPGSTSIIIVATETPYGMLATSSYGNLPRIAALTWGAEDIATALGASANREAGGGYSFTYELARSLCLIGAAAAGVPAVETIHADFRDENGLRAVAEKARRDGFRSMLAIHPAQVDPINAAFTPSQAECAAAQEIVDLFAANPTLGTIALNGSMLDRPYLLRAEAILARRNR
jgi:citrate lyase subunit beta/citryl-CoA lyase